MPAVNPLELASDQRFITMNRHFITVRHGINIHACFGKFIGYAPVMCMP